MACRGSAGELAAAEACDARSPPSCALVQHVRMVIMAEWIRMRNA